MNIVDILRQTWRITWRSWQLWALNLLLLVVFLPAFTLGGAFGGMTALLALPAQGSQPEWLASIRAVPAWVWVAVSLGALILIVLTSAVSWMLQAAAMRGAAMAAERGTFSLGEALDLGWQRVFSIVKLSLTLGLLLAALSLFPLGLLLLAQQTEFGLLLLNMAQVGLAPLNTVLGIALLLVMMSVALEDLRPRAALRRAWRVFGKGWWAFLLTVGISILPGLALGLLALPVVVLLVISFAFIPDLAPLLVIAACSCFGPIGAALILFTAVFTIVLYTLIYQEAARLVAPGTPPAT